MLRMSKKGRVASVALILVSFVLVTRQTGLPLFVTRIPWLGGFLTEAIGVRLTIKYNDGIMASREVFRGRGHVYNHRMVDTRDPFPAELPPLVKGTYYNQHGKAISWIRAGRGVSVFFYSNNVPMELSFYDEGRPCGPSVMWTWGGDVARAYPTESVD